MDRYDPDSGPSAECWSRLDDTERSLMVEDYHRHARIKLPNEHLHALIHTIVENQVAMGDETAAEATLRRLLSEGLDRHDAIHAIGEVLAGHMYRLQKGPVTGDPNEIYGAKLRALTAARWLPE